MNTTRELRGSLVVAEPESMPRDARGAVPGWVLVTLITRAAPWSL